MFSFQVNWWCIALILATVVLLFALKYLKPSEMEGFTVENGLRGIEQMVVCPMLKNNIASNSVLLEGFAEQHAVTSIERTSRLIDSFKNHYSENNCDEYFQSLPSSEEVTVEKDEE